MFRINTPSLALAGLLAASAPALGQPLGNRSAEAIAIHPQVGGTALVEAYFSIDGGDTPLSQDLTTTVEFLVNGTSAGAQTMTAIASPGCPGCPPEFNCVWVGDGTDEWACQAAMTKVELVVLLQPGDEIMVILHPAPGTAPDSDTTDDTLSQPFNDAPVFWNRSITGLWVEQTAGAPDSFFDIFIDVRATASYFGELDLGCRAELLVDGKPTASAPVSQLDLPLAFNPCAFESCDDTVACVMNPLEGWWGTCQPDEELDECGCLYHPVPDQQPLPFFAAIPIDPGSTITVILRPVPGALPELPGFPDDDEEEIPGPPPCPADTNGDAIVDVEDLVAVILDWGCLGANCAGDVNGDAIVDVQDLVAVIVAWGQCFPQ
ncbi:MAG: hypothetical protein ACYTF9_07730 [Planctomycetota bacterium]|jgi:hypothetical protein